ncbi:hypothetical protein FJY93_02365, partial [Candidatus Kaiserbacteria bacterium]|nr:hypothetical protein [Candidatus Kaiserbacteria bacterium]
MNSLSKHFIIPGLIVGFVPHAVAAEVSTISETIGLLNILTGFMFVAAITIFVGGIISYWIDFGNSERIKGIKLMEWGVAILFVLVVFLGVVQFFQGHQA